MGVNSLPKTVTRQRRDCDLNPGPSAPESSTLTTRLPSHPVLERSPLNGCSSSSSSSSNSIIAEDRQTDRQSVEAWNEHPCSAWFRRGWACSPADIRSGTSCRQPSIRNVRSHTAAGRPTWNRCHLLAVVQDRRHTDDHTNLCTHNTPASYIQSNQITLADLGFFRGGDFGNPSERSERALRGSGLTGHAHA